MLSFYNQMLALLKPVSNTQEQKVEEKSIPINKISNQFWIKHANTPKSYILKPILEDKKHHSKGFTILCFGCHGEDSINAHLVAAKIAEVAEKDEVLFIIVTGDNFYPKGVSSPNHKKFETLFENKFLKYPSLKNKVFFIVLGNHDYNFRNFAGINHISGISVAANEVAHTFLNQAGDFDPQKEKYLNQKKLDLDYLSKKNFQWFLPSRCYKKYSEEANAEFYYLDSNAYLRDYLKLEKLNASIQVLETTLASITNEFDRGPLERIINHKKKLRKINQVYWFNRSIQKRPDVRKVVIQHHPLLPVGKRYFDSNIKLYLDDDEILNLVEIFGIECEELNKVNFNHLLKKSFEKSGILEKIDVLIHSDDHASALYNSSVFSKDGKVIKKGFCQLNVGGGGGEFQNIKNFSDIRQILIYSGYGCCSVTFYKDEIIFRIYNIKSENPLDWHSQGKSWVFSNKSLTPVFDWSQFLNVLEKELYLQLRGLILEAIYDYFDAYEQYKKDKNTFVRSVSEKLGLFGAEGRNRGMLLIGLVNNPKPISISAMLSEVCNVLKGSTLLLDKIHKTFHQQKFELMKSSFITDDFNDFLEKFQNNLRSKYQFTLDTESWEMVDKFEAYSISNGTMTSPF